MEKHPKKNLQNFMPRKLKKPKHNSAKKQEGVKVEPALKLSPSQWVITFSLKNHMAWIWPSAEAEIRHVFGFTSITEASIGAAPSRE